MKHPVDAHVGKRIRHRRWMTGMTQQQLGDAVGIKFQQIQKYETGMNRVSASRLYELAGALDVPVAFFFDGMEDAVEPLDATEAAVRPTDMMTDREAMELVRSYYNIPTAQRRHLFDLTRSLGEIAA